jgi:hypothetical protein
LLTNREPGELDVFLKHDSEDEDGDEEAGLKDRRRVMGDARAQLSHVNISNGAFDIENEDYEFIPGEPETNGRVNGVDRSDRAVSSTSSLSSKAGIILVRLLSILSDW